MKHIQLISDNYKELYGLNKFNKVSQDILQSKHTKRLIDSSFFSGETPTPDDFIKCVLSNIKYGFSKGDTLLFAAVIVCREWWNECHNMFDHFENMDIDKLIKEIIIKVKSISYNTNLTITTI